MMAIDRQIIDTVSLASKYPTINRIGIFGSFARGEASPESDIDLLYDYDNSKPQSTDEILGYVEEINDVLLDIAKVSKIDYVWYNGIMESYNSAFRDAVLNDIVWIYDKENS